MGSFGLYQPNAVAGNVVKASVPQPIVRMAKTVAPRIFDFLRLPSVVAILARKC